MVDENLQEQMSEPVVEETEVVETPEQPEATEMSEESEYTPDGDLTPKTKGRLARERKRHEREMRQLTSRLDQLQQMLVEQQSSKPAQDNANFYEDSYGGNDVQKYVNQAVQATLDAQRQQAEQARRAENEAYLREQYDSLRNHLQDGADDYEDYEDVVFNDRTPFTQGMLDIALMLPHSGPGSAREVLYKLAKDPQKLKELSKLHPIQQAREMNNLSRALERGGMGSSKEGYAPPKRMKGDSAMSSQSLNENTPLSVLKKRARNGWRER